MEYMVTGIWIAIAIAMFVIEASTVGLVAIWFGVGSLASAIASIFGMSFKAQIVIFIVVSIVLLLLTRPFVKKIVKPKNSPTNADTLVGKVGVVIVKIDNISGVGRINIQGLDWAAKSNTEEPIPVGEKVIVNRIEGVTLIVTAKKD